MSIDIYAHRAGAGLRPENSLVACQHVLNLGVDVIDIDVVLTQDNVVIAYHDLTLNPDYTRMVDGNVIKSQHAIKDLAYQDLQDYELHLDCRSTYAKQFPQQLDVAHTPIVTLADIIELIKQHQDPSVRLQVEMKTDPTRATLSATPGTFCQALSEVLAMHDMLDRTEIHSFDWRNLQILQAIQPRVITSYISEQALLEHANDVEDYQRQWFAGHTLTEFADSIPRLIQHLGGTVWCPSFHDVTPVVVAQAHELGLRVVPWTVDREIDMLTMIVAQVDGIISNRPDTLRDVLIAQGYKVPKGE